MKNKTKPDWSNTPLFVFLGALSSLVAIFVFVTGKESIPALISTPIPMPTIQNLVAADASTTDENIPFTPTTNTEGIYTNTPEIPVILIKPSQLLPENSDLPSELKITENKTTSNEEIAKAYENPTDVYQQLLIFGRKEGVYMLLSSPTYNSTCSSETGLVTTMVSIALLNSPAGASEYHDWGKSFDSKRLEEGNLIEGVLIDETIVGDKSYATKAEWFQECKASQGENSEWISYEINFQRYNATADVYVDGVKDAILPETLEEIALRIAKLVDLKIVASTK